MISKLKKESNLMLEQVNTKIYVFRDFQTSDVIMTYWAKDRKAQVGRDFFACNGFTEAEEMAEAYSKLYFSDKPVSW